MMNTHGQPNILWINLKNLQTWSWSSSHSLGTRRSPRLPFKLVSQALRAAGPSTDHPLLRMEGARNWCVCQIRETVMLARHFTNASYRAPLHRDATPPCPPQPSSAASLHSPTAHSASHHSHKKLRTPACHSCLNHHHPIGGGSAKVPQCSL